MAEQSGITSKDYFNHLGVLHSSLFMGPVLFALISIFINRTKTPLDGELSTIFLFMVPLFAIGAIIGSHLISKSQLAAIKTKAELSDKLQDYRGLIILRYALIEGAALFSIVTYFLTANFILLGIGALLVIFLGIQRPTKAKVAKELYLNKEERTTIEDPDAVVM